MGVSLYVAYKMVCYNIILEILLDSPRFPVAALSAKSGSEIMKQPVLTTHVQYVEC